MKQFTLKVLMALLVSVLVLWVLYSLHTPLAALVLVGLSQMVWLVVMLGSRSSTRLVAPGAANDTVAGGELEPRVQAYYQSLGASYEQCVQRYHVLELQVASRLQQTRQQVQRAEQLSRQTLQLAMNASLSAARCGEAGQGFAKVSEELLTLNRYAEQDLASLGSILEKWRAQLLTNRCREADGSVESTAGLAWHVYLFLLPQAMSLYDTVSHALATLDRLEQRYQVGSALDVRGMQLAEAVARLLEDIRSLGDGQLAMLQTLIRHLNLIALSEPGRFRQLLENSTGLATLDESGKKLTEFVT